MRLGEGTGAVLAMPIIESAVVLYLEMATFKSAGISEAVE
jgi:nicotinate-nucleotide--dimethylbenzimidazole phosphoribosyltransferase